MNWRNRLVTSGTCTARLGEMFRPRRPGLGLYSIPTWGDPAWGTPQVVQQGSILDARSSLRWEDTPQIPFPKGLFCSSLKPNTNGPAISKDYNERDRSHIYKLIHRSANRICFFFVFFCFLRNERRFGESETKVVMVNLTRVYITFRIRKWLVRDPSDGSGRCYTPLELDIQRSMVAWYHNPNEINM